MIARSPLFLLLGLPAFAQTSAFDDPDLRIRPWVCTSGVTRGVSAELTGDLRPDLVLLDGSQLVLAYSPGAFISFTPFGDPANDVCRLPQSSAGVEHVLAVGPEGLSAYHVDYDQTTFIQPATIDDQPASAGGWRDARRAVPARFPLPGVVGVDAAGTALLLLEDPLGAKVHHAPIPVGAQVFDLVAADFDGDGIDEIVVVAANGVHTVELDGELIGSSPAPFVGGHVVAVRPEAGTSPEAVATVDIPGGGCFLAVPADGTGALTYLGPDPIEGLAAGALDTDPGEDLVLALPATAADPLVWISNQGGGASNVFDVGSAAGIAVGSSSAAVGAVAPVLADFDLDGDVDLAQYVDGDGELVIVENQSVDAGTRRLHTHYFEVQTDLDEAISQLMSVFDPPQALPFAPTAIEIEHWIQKDLTGLHSTGVDLFHLDLPDTGSEPWNDFATWRTTEHTALLWSGTVHPLNISYSAIRLVRLDAGEVVDAGPTTIFAVTSWWPDFLEPILVLEQHAAQFGEVDDLLHYHPEKFVDIEDDPGPEPLPGTTFGPPDFGSIVGSSPGGVTKGSGGGDLPDPPSSGGGGENPPQPPGG